MKSEHLNHIESDQTLLERSDQLWQTYLQQLTASDTGLESFWDDYQHILQTVKNQQAEHQNIRSLVWNEQHFVTNESHYKSLPVPIGKYFYKDLRMSLEGYGIAGITIAWFFNWVWIDMLNPIPFIKSFLVTFQIISFFIILSKFFGLLHRNQHTILSITSKYIYDQARNKVVAFKDIHSVKKTWFGLKLIFQPSKRKKPRSFIVPKKAEEYQDIKQFFEQVAQVNDLSPNTYLDLFSIFQNYWPNASKVTFSPEKRSLLQFKRHKLTQLSITSDKLLFLITLKKSKYTIKIPLHEIYYLQSSKKRLRILGKNKSLQWSTNDPVIGYFRPILTQTLPDFHKIKLFLEEVAIFNHS
ncbi:hypothetical protein BKI52_09565 [marine bacterium AO1-C]|nr:hypothetical protein BKI52_09565 [marine bacterium AO1-C]